MGNNIQKFLDNIYPDNGKLVTHEDGTIGTTIIDADTDGIHCKFNNDGCVELNTDSYSYITLDKTNLHYLMVMIEEAEKKYDEEPTCENCKHETPRHSIICQSCLRFNNFSSK